MRIALVVALLAVMGLQALRRFASFTVPFTDRLIVCGANARVDTCIQMPEMSVLKMGVLFKKY